jgi:hypothetical protein
VPTVERGFFDTDFCSIEIAGLSPSIESGVQRVEGERGFSRPRHAGDYHQAVARDLDPQILEVVLARTADDDRFHANRRP